MFTSNIEPFNRQVIISVIFKQQSYGDTSNFHINTYKI